MPQPEASVVVDIFLSYSRENAAVAKMLAQALQQSGFTVWWDKEIPPGKSWDEVIGQQLDSAKCVIVLWSKASVQSRWVREEAERAATRKCLIPVFIEKVDPPFGFGYIEAADLSEWKGDRNAPEFAQLCDAARGSAGGECVGVAPALTSPVPEAIPPVREQSGTKMPWLAIGVLAVVLVAAIGIYFAFKSPSQPETVVLPSVIGLRYGPAEKSLLAKGFKKVVRNNRAAAEAATGTVVEQRPRPGTALPLDSSIELVVAK